MKRAVRVRHLILAVALNVILVLACLPAESEPSTPTPIGPFALPTPTPPPPTPTPTPLPSLNTGTVVQEMSRRHEVLSPEKVNQVLARFLPAHTRRAAQYGVITYRIWFRTRDENDQVIAIQADLRFPRVETVTEFPVFVYGAGTTGIGNECACLNEQFAGVDWGDYRSHMMSYASQGYVTILPNWQGYDDRDRTHPYFVAELEGRVLLDAARAVYDFFQEPPADDILARPVQKVFFGGYSQGGHGAFAADRLAPSYAPELKVMGIIGHATAPDVEGLMYDSPLYAPYIVYAYRNFYGEDVIDPARVFLPKWLPTFDSDVTSKCIDECFNYYPNDARRLLTPEFSDALYGGRLGEVFPAFKEKLDLNYVGNGVNPAVPALILHGTGDDIVQLRTIDRFIGRLCEAGKPVNYNRYVGISHFQTRQYSFAHTLEWMKAVLDGNTPESVCGALGG
jgi:dienelactone hydrolase